MSGAALSDAIERLRAGDTASARRQAESAAAADAGDPAPRAFLGMLLCRTGDLAAGIVALRAALALAPADGMIRLNLTTALLESGKPDEALAVCTRAAADPVRSLPLARMRAYLLQLAGSLDEAITGYAEIVARLPADFESWNNLGNARLAAGDVDRGVAALRRASTLRPDNIETRLNLAAALGDAGEQDAAIEVLRACVAAFPADRRPADELGRSLLRLDRGDEAVDALEEAKQRAPNDAGILVRLGIARSGLFEFAAAEAAFEAAIALDARRADAHVQLALLFEHGNRAADLSRVIALGAQRGIDRDNLQFMRVLEARRDGRLEHAVELIRALPEDVEPVRSAELLGRLLDRLGDADGAFAAFERMNALARHDPSDPPAKARQYRAVLETRIRVTTPQWHARWRSATIVERDPAPVFLVGFPRSGTTLLDTMLLGHPNVRVLEEMPTLRGFDEAVGGFERISGLDASAIDALRERYFERLDRFADAAAGMTVIDKFPLYMNRLPLLHRLFPRARFILSLRHPCDVVLSCFITNFRLNHGMSNFLDLADAARLYDMSFRYLEQCRAILPMEVCVVRYEALVADREAALRPLFSFLGLDWNAAALDHGRTAMDRGHIRTASYSQVTEPIYDRAAGRWRRYARHLEPVLPVLAPWVERLGYTL